MMKCFFFFSLLALLAAAITAVTADAAYGTADCLMENCAPIQSGYLDGYNFDPAVVGGSTWGLLWNTYTTGGKASGEQFIAQPITYTPPGGNQVVIVMSENNNGETFLIE